MRRYLIGCTMAGALALTAAVGAQDPPRQTPPPQNPPRQTPPPQDPTRTPSTQAQANVTVEGCLMREADVPGRKPNVAERAGIAEDYILTSAKVIKGSAPAGTAPARPGESPTGTAGTRDQMYEVEGIAEADLKKNVGRRVQIEGMFENVDRARATPESKTPADDLVEINGKTIRQVSGECPPK
jgi:hypothetical protein